MKTLNRFFDTLWLWYKGTLEFNKRMREIRRNKKRLRRAKRHANERALATGKKQWVVKRPDGYYHVLNRNEINALKRAGLFDKKATTMDFDREAPYVVQMSNREFLKKK